MRGHLKLAVTVVVAAAFLGVNTASAERPVHVRAGNLDLTFNGGFTPKTLSRTKLTPISVFVSGQIKTVDGTHPPAIEEFVVETDKNVAVDVKGVPVCRPSLESQDTKQAEVICSSAIIGTGQGMVEISFPEQAPIFVRSKIIAFNGGFRGGVTTLYVHAYITVPTPGAIVSTVKITKIHHGRYGLKAVTSIPKIAGGNGSVTQFDLTIDREGVFAARCADGRLQAHGTATFSDGTRASAEVVRRCGAKG